VGLKAEKMSDAKTQSWPSDKIQRRLRRDEALIEMVRAERVFLASRRLAGGLKAKEIRNEQKLDVSLHRPRPNAPTI
jgi:hypothetical protein